MSKIFEINWSNFKAKFDGKEQKSFEFLCYLLFCNEFNQNIGIFRYKNQAGIETEPIEYEGKVIGFQSKFYETKISYNVDDIKDSIKKAKDKNSNLNKVLFYINQEFSESSKKQQKVPQYKTDIEEYAISKGIEIEWRVPSHFEKQLTLEENKSLVKHFFGLEKSSIDFIGELVQHTKSILTPIHSRIEFMGNIIKLDRSGTLLNLKKVLEKSPIVVLSGEGGVGKTAVIKDFYEQVKETVPMFIFKATEFNITSINDIFKNYGNFTLLDFMSEYKDKSEKYIIIDSAEKLSDIEHQEVFQEYLSTLLNNKWKIIFTTRHSYLDDLKFQFVEVYHIAFIALNIEKIKIEELTELSGKYCFNLPKNERLFELLQNPFYLSEYLQNYENLDNLTSLSDFKSILWNKQIAKSVYRKNNIHVRREESFLKIAQIRANEGHFFIKISDCDNEALQNLERDEIIKYDTNSGGYFITHDIYEEWALDKIIERYFTTIADNESFFGSMGSSLAIRRAFRNWLSEKLIINQDNVKSLIEKSFIYDNIEAFWKDEIIVSVLLSEYSKVFFQIFEKTLLENEQKLLLRAVFLLRIACKEIDESFLTLLGLRKINDSVLPTLFTKPKGTGWSCVIDFINKHKEKVGNKNISTILPMLADWNNKNTAGETTKKASQIGLFYYENIVKKGGFGYRFEDEKKGQLIKVILQGASEIKDELINIFNGVIARNEPSHNDRDYELIKVILSSITDSYEVIKILPDYVIKLAELFWIKQKPKSTKWYEHDSLGVEKYFGLSDKHDFRYFPSSAFQTPVYQLLRYAPKVTIDFILSFTNKAVECYANSELKNEVHEIQVFINDSHIIKQYISNRLWNMYRGTQVSTGLLESIHMAFEKWLLEYSKIESAEQIEYLFLYLIKNTRSTSITAVITSAVLAQPSKLFNIAKILFQTKEFFQYDTSRLVQDQSIRSLYSIGYGLDFIRKIHQDERLKTCEDEHRKKSLEHIALYFQFFRTEGESANEAEDRQKNLWEIFDKYYEELENKSTETGSDRTWRLYLARMDRRKMNPKVEKVDEGILIYFNPEMDPELKKYSEESLRGNNEAMKYTQLKLWSDYRFSGDVDKYSGYQQYENNPQLVVTEVKEIIQGLEEGKIENFRLLNSSIPAYACSVLIRDFPNKLCLEEKEFCKEIILGIALMPFSMEHHTYQVLDGTEPAITSLPYLCKYFSKDKEDIKGILFLLLLSAYGEVSTFAIRAILNSLWEISFEDAHAIFIGYLYIKAKYDDLFDEIKEENYKNNVYDISEGQILKSFVERYETELENIIQNKVDYDILGSVDGLDLETLITAFELLPLRTKNNDHVKFLTEIFSIFSKRVFEDDRYDDEERFDYTLKIRFLEKFAYFILSADKEMIEYYIQPFVENFSVSREASKLFHQFVYVEDRLNQYEEFWLVWNAFYGRL